MTTHAGDLLREWRRRRRLSQLDLAIAANVSSRHLSFVETGRAKPTSDMILHLAEHLDVPLRDRNALLLAGGYAPAYPERGLAEPELKAVRHALREVLAGHEPYPAVVVNRWWELVDANPGIGLFTRRVTAKLLEPPVNVLRLRLHPDGMAPRIANLPEWRAHLLARLHRQAEATGDQRLAALHDELAAYPGGESGKPRQATDVVVPLRSDRRRRRAGALLHQPHRHGRHADGRHRRGAGHRVVLPGRRDAPRPAELGRPSPPEGVVTASADRDVRFAPGPFGPINRPRAAPGRSGNYGRGMDDKEIMAHIDELIETEHKLRQQLAAGELSAPEERERLRSAEEALDQCWDLLRQRRARREFGENPDEAASRPVSEVEGYQQ